MPTPRKIFKNQIYSTSHGNIKVVNTKGKHVTVKFLKTGTVKTTISNNVLTGKIKDPYFPNIFGKGFIGEGKYGLTKHRRLYTLWWNMLNRVYVYRANNGKGHKVSNRWHNFQLFCQDIVKMPNYNKKGFELDKDLLVIGNRKYSRKYCTFVPKAINTLLAVYNRNFTRKQLKQHIIKTANKYKESINKIIYENLVNFDVNKLKLGF